MKYYIPKHQKPVSPLVNKLIEDEEFFNTYTKFKKTLPDNLRFGNPNDFNMYRYWELNEKPKNFEEGLNRKMFTFDNKDKKYHASSVAYNKDNDSYEIMKSKNHPTLDLEFQDYANNTEFRKKYKYDGGSHSYIRRTEPYSPYIKDYPKQIKINPSKPNDEYDLLKYLPFMQMLEKLQRDIRQELRNKK